ncbi:hypothetical protein [Candidatus Entotheonella palauensis]|uniref:hypothetical protein n=1 Tax=Candidatus Entotheonella palauensis TaxID=93172 RepID=UPI000B7C8991|nr:hypothetical protein [Candidatus Entotheonella palauensis]
MPLSGPDKRPEAENRLRFEELDLQATDAVVRLLKAAAKLAEENPEEFFGISATQRQRMLAEAAGIASVTETNLNPEAAISSVIQLLGRGGPSKLIEDLIELLIAEKQYWKPESPPGGSVPPEEFPPPGEPLFPPAVPGRRQCRVRSFRVPTQRTGCRLERQDDGLIHLFEGFALEADFEQDTDGSICACCEYRQYVSGQFFLNGRPSVEMVALADEDGTPTGEQVPLQPFPSFVEDSLIEEGANTFYDHRAEGNDDPSDRYLPDRANGCSYRGTDFPGWSNLQENQSAGFDLTFLGVIIDTCNGRALRAANIWTVRCFKP